LINDTQLLFVIPCSSFDLYRNGIVDDVKLYLF
jgi:hypothetical protein